MGLDTTHDCWHGSYSTFSEWRTYLCRAAGYGELVERDGFGGKKPWPDGDVLVQLLNHSDCDGSLPWGICNALADRLEELLPAMRMVDPLGYMGGKTDDFITGLRLAYAVAEDVEFH